MIITKQITEREYKRLEKQLEAGKVDLKLIFYTDRQDELIIRCKSISNTNWDVEIETREPDFDDEIHPDFLDEVEEAD